MWYQREFAFKPRARGFHLVTREVLEQMPEVKQFQIGLLHLFLLHTSASLTINENADPDVRLDMETYMNVIVPERGLPLTHTVEGPDDMPAHVKSSLLGPALTIPIRGGALALGTWQGIYLCEHRNRGGERRVVATLNGQTTSTA